jgi:YidC/Oxa1 family membrane protein insertase
MKANQALQPQLQEIRKKYANDQQTQMMQIQALYKEYGVNPMAGCLPMVIQLPVLYGLFDALRSGIGTNKLSELNANIYPFIQHFSTFPDISFRWFAWLSFLNPILHLDWSWTFPLNQPDPSHVLPILAGLATFVSLRMSQPRTSPTTGNGKPAQPDPTQQSMKMMQYIMPFFIVFLGWNYSAGLALYWTVSSIFQAVQQYFVTGWGSLMITPALKKEVSSVATTTPNRQRTVNATNGKGNGSSTTASARNAQGNKTKSVDGASADGDGEATSDDDAASAVGSRSAAPRPGGGSGSSSYSRSKQRSGSASARRRSSNNTQRSRR